MAKIEKTASFHVSDLEGSERLDRYLASRSEELTRTIVANSALWLNGKPAKKGNPVRNGDEIRIEYTLTVFEGLVAQRIDFPIIFEDGSILVIDKPQGLVVHPASGNWDNTLANGLLYRYGERILAVQDENGDGIRPGIVHRLDKETSGVMVVALTPAAHRALGAQFKDRSTKKIYIALVAGRVKNPKGTIDAHIRRDPIDRKKMAVCPDEKGRSALTEYTVLRRFSDCTLLHLVLHTGRTHQIRVHLNSIGHPVIGDPLYGREVAEGMMLHAKTLALTHPLTEERMTFTAPLPRRFFSYLKL
ncbi:MAG: RluA family pseudouridine synthase [Spirochaetales bacterium]|nr:RluA family pseudouridine synthase [Spirochaetales bacterium]